MTLVRHWATPLLLGIASACSAAPEELEGAPVEPGAFYDIAERENATHFNHWAPNAAGGITAIGVNNLPQCATGRSGHAPSDATVRSHG